MLISKLAFILYCLSVSIPSFISLSLEKLNMSNFKYVELFFLCLRVLLAQIEFEGR